MPKAISEIAIGAGLVALDVFAPEIGIPATLATMAGSAGAGVLLGGIGSLLKKQQTGIATNTINPIAPWNPLRKKRGEAASKKKKPARDPEGSAA